MLRDNRKPTTSSPASSNASSNTSASPPTSLDHRRARRGGTYRPNYTYTHRFINMNMDMWIFDIGREKRPRWLCCKPHARTVYCAVRGEDATSSYAAYARLHSTCTSTPSEPGHMHACDAAVPLRVRENSPGTRVPGGEQEVRLLSSFLPAYIPCFRARLTIELPFFFLCPFRAFFSTRRAPP
jgi:hypothetical protein